MNSKLSYEKVRVMITTFPYPVRKKEKGLDLDLSNVDQVVLESINFMRSACKYLSPDLEKNISELQTPTQSLLQMLNPKQSSTDEAKPSTNEAKPSTDEAKPSTIKDHAAMQTNTNVVDSSLRGGVRVRIGGTLYYSNSSTKPWMNKSRNIR
ncbi:MAG: hypothetical protein E6230_18055 [Paenibacillus dendritiformis]|uniref:hypothetical protein n=1 Tax=uncultured Paenibacillus sp. TaxID=227322 RepID=UPI0025F69D18|nr:hypothetical protein [uncultured Paenibacillus sp.]MDU5144075.1 hypothetical protein [Paenibacillus dendritiformis]